MKRMVSLLALMAVWIGAPSVWALGGDHDRFPIVTGPGGWSQEYVDFFNSREWVHGYFVNAGDVFFYAGDTNALNEFLDRYEKLKDTVHELVLHVGRKKAHSPWDKSDRDIDVDWSLYADRWASKKKPGQSVVSRVDVWLWRSVQLESLMIPSNVSVKSAGEIDQFIAEHEKDRKSSVKRK